MGYHPEILGLLILACSVNLLPTPTEEHRYLNITGMKTRHVRRAPTGTWSNQGSRSTNEGADSFVFPDDSGVERFIPKFGKRTPDCANGTTFCENVENYPRKYLENMLKDNVNEFVGLFGNDIIDNNINYRIDYDESPLCLSVEQVVYPKTAKNKDDQWLYVVNQGHYRQGIRIEKCVAPTWSNQGSRSTNEADDPFVFADDSGVERFIPKFGKRTPDCANGTTFCENVENYPSKYLENMLEDNGKEFVGLFGNDIIDSNINYRIDYDESPLCLSVEQVVYPKTAKNKDDQWFYVVNQGQYRQGIRIEKCVTPTNRPQSCAFTEGFPIGYKTECRQKYIYRRLLALNEDGKTIADSFQLPSCYVCIDVQDSSLRSRVGTPSKN